MNTVTTTVAESTTTDKAAIGRPPPRTLCVLSDEEAMNLPPVEWLIDGVIQQGTVNLLYGAWGLGKTHLALSAAFSIAAGLDWMGGSVKQGPVVYVLAEGPNVYPPRSRAWKQALGVEGLRDMYLVPTAVNLFDKTEVTVFIERMRAMEPTFIVFDTLSRCCVGAEENSARDMGIVISHLDKIRHYTAATILLLHHSTKGDRKVERGSGVVMGAMDGAFSLSERAGSKVLTLTCEKQRAAAPFDSVKVRLQVVDLPSGESSVVAVQDGQDESSDELSKLDGNILALLSDGQRLAPGEIRDAISGKDRSCRSSLSKLVRLGLLDTSGSTTRSRYWITDKGLSYNSGNGKTSAELRQEAKANFCGKEGVPSNRDPLPKMPESAGGSVR